MTNELISRETAENLARDVQTMGTYILQMGQLLNAMQKRMDEMEARQAQVTVSHNDVKRLNAQIRYRAGELCAKYGLQDGKSPKVLRAAIKKDLMSRWQIRDLHDLPAAAKSGAENQIANWTNIRLVMERRASA